MSKDLGHLNAFGAEAIGQPGQRRFRLFARSKRGAAFFWMEKEQLNHLSLIIDLKSVRAIDLAVGHR